MNKPIADHLLHELPLLFFPLPLGFHLPPWAPGASQDYQLSLGGSTAARLSFVASFP